MRTNPVNDGCLDKFPRVLRCGQFKTTATALCSFLARVIFALGLILVLICLFPAIGPQIGHRGAALQQAQYT
ncbi:MAG: hypothetical protein ACRD37_12385, partial [Candidatus Acidiferrales bacterium]